MQFSCTSSEAAEVVDAYYDTYSGAKFIDLPSGLFKGHEEVFARLPVPDSLRWYMNEPEVRPVFKGRCTVSVEFEGRLEIS